MHRFSVSSEEQHGDMPSSDDRQLGCNVDMHRYDYLPLTEETAAGTGNCRASRDIKAGTDTFGWNSFEELMEEAARQEQKRDLHMHARLFVSCMRKMRCECRMRLNCLFLYSY